MTTWDDVAAVALLGAGRRPLAADDLPPPLEQAWAALPGSGQDAAAVLDLAALATAYRRAGVRPAPTRALSPPAPDDPRPGVAPAAASRLVIVIARADAELLELWLTTAAARGVRPPDRLLPALLDAATRQPAVADALARATGPRARWLAQHREHWATAMARTDGSEADDPLADDAWSAGTPSQRLAWLRRLRAEDAVAARDLLEAGWAREGPAERAALLGVLEAGLEPGDEPFLERCLTDRRADVRTIAAGLLARLPGSAFAGRAAARALAAVRVERQLLRRRLVVSPPQELDEAVIPDQAPAAPRRADPGQGPVARSVRQAVAAPPLRTWVPALAATPADLVSLDVTDGWGELLWCAWAEATLREEDPAWAGALLARPPRAVGANTHEVPGLVSGLVAVLPVARRADLVARWLAEGFPLAEAVLTTVPAPWPDRLAHVVVERLVAGAAPGDLGHLLTLAARRLPAGWAPAVAAAGARHAEPSLRRRYDEAADLILFRSAMLEEIR